MHGRIRNDETHVKRGESGIVCIRYWRQGSGDIGARSVLNGSLSLAVLVCARDALAAVRGGRRSHDCKGMREST